MATEVWFSIPRRQIEQTGVTFRRKTNSGLHGELTVCQNDIIWRPKGNEYIFKVSWRQFAAFAQKPENRVLPKMTPVRVKKRHRNTAA